MEEERRHQEEEEDFFGGWKKKKSGSEGEGDNNTSIVKEEDDMEACFKAFDRDEDNSLNINEFTSLLKALFRNERGRPYPMDAHMSNELFTIFNVSGDGSMNREEFIYCWNNWIKKIVRPVSAIIIVDVQNDFISGTLAISNCPAGQNGEEVVSPINKLLDTVPFDVYCYSLDWHPADHLSFVDNVTSRKLHKTSPISDPSQASVYDTVVFEGPPVTEQTLWPRHCVQETWGAELHKDLKVHPEGYVVHKGVNPNIDSYSAFFDNQKLSHTEMEAFLKSRGITDIFVHPGSIMIYKGVHSFIESYSSFYDNDRITETNMRAELQQREVTDIFVCGLAMDVCVASTAFHGLELGFRTALIDDCSRGIQSEGIKNTVEKVKNDHGVVIQSSEVKAMVQGRDRRVELGYQLALNCRKSIIYPVKNKNSRFNPGSSNNSPLDNKSDGGSSKSNHNAVKASV